MKICDTCRKSISTRSTKPKLDLEDEVEGEEEQNADDQDDEEPQSQNLPSQASSSFSTSDSQTCKDKLMDIFDQLNLEPIKLNQVHENSKVPLLKRRIQEATNVMCKKAKSAYHLSEDVQCFPTDDVEEKAKQYDEIMDRIKVVIESCDYSTKLRLLTLVPNLQQKKIQKCLGITRSTADAASKLKERKGLFSIREKKRGSTALSEEDKQKVIDFYCDETSGNSKMLPGKKDCVSIRKKVYRQKQLLLLNLRELHAAYKTLHPSSKVGLSSFCLLRPKWCILPGSPGSHTICVCTIHQNVELLLHAVGSKLTSSDIISKLVCDPTSKICMLRECKDCPSGEEFDRILRKLLDPNFEEPNIEEAEESDDEDQEEESEENVIEFKQWVSTDRTELISRNLPESEFYSFLSSAFLKLIPHAYTTIEQHKYIKQRKKSLGSDTCLVLMDFSENYSFITQDQAQGYYWTKNCCTVHPAVIYFQNNNEEAHQSFCFLSDDMNHDTSIVHIFQDRIVEYIKEKLPNIKRVHYFSDGCGAQYKNCNNFLRLCEHYDDYDLSATWTFFPTSHGKSPCDGIGGTIKREAANESLRRPYDKQILDVESLIEFCNKKNTNIRCELIRKQDVEEYRGMEIFKACTVPGTRSFHEFVPLNNHVIRCKKTSTDPDYCLTFDLIGNKRIKT